MHQPNPDGPCKSGWCATFDPFGINQRDQRIHRDTPLFRRRAQTVPEKGLQTDRCLMAIDRDRVFDRWVIGDVHLVSTYAARR